MKALKNALITIRRSPYQSLLAILMTTITFFVAYSFSLAILGAEQILKYFESQPQVIAFFELKTEENLIQDLAAQIREKPYVESITVVTKQEALKLYQESHKQNSLLMELVTADILPASIEVSARQVEDLETIKHDLEGAPGVEEVVFQKDIVEALTNWTKSVRIIGLTITAVLGLVSFLMMVVMISMKVVTKKTAIKIMKIIGATNWYVVSPFITEGMLYGVAGSLLGWGAMFATLLYLTPWIQRFLGTIITLPIPIEVFAWQLGLGTAAGMVLGSLASLVAAERMLKK